jgi:hypothetical protein
MTQVVRISLPGKDVFTSSDPNDFSLFADQDNVLLKQDPNNRATLGTGTSLDHNYGYIPFYLAYGDLGSGVYQLGTGFDGVSGVPRARTTATQLKNGWTGDLEVFLFFDNMN